MFKLFKKVVRSLFVIVYIIVALISNASFLYADEETTYFFLNDHLGSTDVILDMDGNVVERAD